MNVEVAIDELVKLWQVCDRPDRSEASPFSAPPVDAQVRGHGHQPGAELRGSVLLEAEQSPESVVAEARADVIEAFGHALRVAFIPTDDLHDRRGIALQEILPRGTGIGRGESCEQIADRLIDHGSTGNAAKRWAFTRVAELRAPAASHRVNPNPLVSPDIIERFPIVRVLLYLIGYASRRLESSCSAADDSLRLRGPGRVTRAVESILSQTDLVERNNRSGAQN